MSLKQQSTHRHVTETTVYT